MISSIIDYILHIDNHLAHLVTSYGSFSYVIIFLIIFAEVGIILTPFLPGDSLLFAAGMIASRGSLSIGLLSILMFTAALLGTSLNYWVGTKIGHLLFTNDDAIFFKKRYLQKTHDFYEKYGGKTLIIAFFIPFVRTYAPFVGGISSMRFWQFLMYSAIGAFGWIMLILYTSYFFGNIKWIAENFSVVIILIIIASVLWPMLQFWHHRQQKKKAKAKNT